jgi:hypothetical protein
LRGLVCAAVDDAVGLVEGHVFVSRDEGVEHVLHDAFRLGEEVLSGHGYG